MKRIAVPNHVGKQDKEGNPQKGINVGATRQ